MTLKIILLGTSSMTPTDKRNHPSVYVNLSKGILFDVGEGTQRQIRIAKIKPSRIDYVFISHWHGDHSLGLPGLMQMLVANNYKKTLTIVGPKGSKKRINYMLKAFEFTGELKFEIIEEQPIEFDNYRIEFIKLKHSTNCLGYRIIQKPKIKLFKDKISKLGLKGPIIKELKNGGYIKINNKTISWKDVGYKTEEKILFSYIADTLYFPEIIDFVKDTKSLVIECTYSSKDKDKAKEHYHMAVDDVCKIIRESHPEKAILFHFSQRYKEIEEIKNDLKRLKCNAIIGNDFDSFEISLK